MMSEPRLYKLGVGTGLVTMVLGALLALAPMAGASDHGDPRGNNGTVKIDGVHPVDGPGHSTGPNDPGQHPDNDPHVLCQFELEFFGFDQGQTADIRIALHSPTGDLGDLVNDTGVLISSDPAGGAGNDDDVVIPYDLSDQLADVEPHPQHGWHVKLYLTLYNADDSEVPGGKKHKVFWIEDCVPEEIPEPGVTLVKTNDADDDDTFTDEEEAPGAGSDVTFRLEITNTGNVPLTIASLEDTWVGQDEPLDLLAEELDCTRDGEDVSLAEPLPVDSTTTCDFTVTDYAPAAGGSLENTVEVTTEEGVGDEDTSIVTTPPAEPTFSVTIDKRNDADDDGEFTDDEQAPAAGADVEFEITITNTGSGDLVLESLVDRWGDEELDLLDAETGLDCTRDESAVALAEGSTLPAGSVTVCTFTVEDYAPATGSLTNTVTVETDEAEPDEDDSTVRAPLGEEIIPPPTVATTYGVTIVKRNDADRDGTFSDAELAARPGDAVEFQVAIRNTGTGALVLRSLTDQVPGRGTIDLLGDDVDLDCGTTELRQGSVLAAGSTTICTFLLQGYAPAAGAALTNTATVVTDQVRDSDTSRVDTVSVVVLPAPPVENPPAIPPLTPPLLTPPLQTPPAVTPPAVAPDAVAGLAPQVRGDVVARALPRTGGDSQGLFGMGAFLIALGAALVLGSRRQLSLR
jgi:LPXTG-motif cell wall-anchored protein